MWDTLNASASNWPHAAVRGSHHTDLASRKPVEQGEFELRARVLIGPVGEVVVVKCFSKQVQCGDPESADLAASLMELAKLGPVQVLLNLQGVHFASGSLLGSLACLHLKIAKAGGFLRLFGLEPILRDALRICRLDTALETYATEAEALSAHRPRPAVVELRMPRWSRGQ